MFEPVSRDCREAVLIAAEEVTVERGAPWVGSEHLLMGWPKSKPALSPAWESTRESFGSPLTSSTGQRCRQSVSMPGCRPPGNGRPRGGVTFVSTGLSPMAPSEPWSGHYGSVSIRADRHLPSGVGVGDCRRPGPRREADRSRRIRPGSDRRRCPPALGPELIRGGYLPSLARRAASSSAARSRSIVSGLSPLRRLALTSPSVT